MANRKDFMNSTDRHAMGDQPRTHQNCKELTGRARPGKTAQDRAKGERRKTADAAPAPKGKR